VADIHLKVTGDGSEGHDALEHVGEGAGHAHEKVTGLGGAMHELGEELGKTMVSANLFSAAIEKGIESVKEFAAESVKAYMAQEQADRNLSLMAGNLTSAFKEQAEEFEKLYGVAATVTEKVQTLALAHGADRDQVLELTEATTKWAAITGTDAASAAENLVRAVESGRHSSKNLGIQWQETGDKAEDLKNAIEALNSKLAGADPTADATLEGRTNKAKLAMEGLQKSFGSWIANVEKKTGALDKLAAGLDLIREKAGAKGVGAWLGMATPLGLAGGAVGAQIGALGSDPDVADAPAPTHFADPEGDTADVHKKFDDAIAKGQLERAKKYAEQLDRQNQEEFAARAKRKKEENDEALKLQDDYQKQVIDGAKLTDDNVEKAEDDHQAAMLKLLVTGEETELKVEMSNIEARDKAWNEHYRKLEALREKENKKAIEEMGKAGEEIGAALINSMESVMDKAINGQDVKWQQIAGSTVQTVLTIVGTAIGSYYGAPQLGGAIGGLAGSFANAGINQIKHEGGWVERYHSGGFPGMLGPNERPIIAEAGEYVASRREVNAAGGPAGVRQALSGGGRGMNITIVAQDATDVQHFYEGRGGRGLRRAIRSGRGNAAAIYSGG
jgi:hypothetical protein